MLNLPARAAIPREKYTRVNVFG